MKVWKVFFQDKLFCLQVLASSIEEAKQLAQDYKPEWTILRVELDMDKSGVMNFTLHRVSPGAIP